MIVRSIDRFELIDLGHGTSVTEGPKLSLFTLLSLSLLSLRTRKKNREYLYIRKNGGEGLFNRSFPTAQITIEKRGRERTRERAMHS